MRLFISLLILSFFRAIEQLSGTILIKRLGISITYWIKAPDFEPVKLSWAYTSMQGGLVRSYMVYIYFYVLAIYFLGEVVRRDGSLERNQVTPILQGCTTALVIGTETNVVMPAFEVQVPERRILVAIQWMVCRLYAV